jgi:hypothetical protein
MGPRVREDDVVVVAALTRAVAFCFRRRSNFIECPARTAIATALPRLLSAMIPAQQGLIRVHNAGQYRGDRGNFNPYEIH